VDAPLLRISLPPGERTGLKSASQVMVDKIVSVPRSSIVREVGRCDDDAVQAVDDALRQWLAL
jgi:mRNA interferase MazF